MQQQQQEEIPFIWLYEEPIHHLMHDGTLELGEFGMRIVGVNAPPEPRWRRIMNKIKIKIGMDKKLAFYDEDVLNYNGISLIDAINH
jgi:hypothetical protein